MFAVLEQVGQKYREMVIILLNCKYESKKKKKVIKEQTLILIF